MVRTTITLAAVGALLIPVATAHAAVDTIGSDLSGSATTAIQRTKDTALAQLSGGTGPAVPTGGQVLSMQVKGCSGKANVPQNPETALYIQDLRGSGASRRVISISQQFHLPVCGAGGADMNTVTSFAPQDQCVEAGDLVGIVVGGQTPGYPQGTQYFIAKPSPGAILGVFSGNGRTVSGSSYTLAPLADTELLAQTRIGTGSDSPAGCAGGGGGGGGGGGSKPSASSLQLPSSVSATNGRGQLQAACGLAAGDTCKVSLVATKGKKRPQRVGTVAGSVPGGQTATLTLKLNRAGKRALSKGGFSATLRGTVRGAGGAATVSRKLLIKAG
jgi:hypothetical protein